MAAENFKVKKGLEVGTAITATSSGINVTGIITATQLIGDGSGLTGVTGSGSGVIVKHDGSTVGTAGTINFSTNLDVSPIHLGIVTVTASSNPSIAGINTSGTSEFNNLDVDGQATFTGNVELTSTDSGAAAAPTLRLQRDSSSPANGDILGQIMFGGKDSTPNDENYASVAGKIINSGAGGEHGAIQITTRKQSVSTVTANLTSTDYELLNGTNLSVDGDITGNGNFQLTSTDTGSSAAPELTLFRNSTSPADADYLGQIKFSGKHDAGSSVNYAKITGKILDASDGSEDGILEFAFQKAGSNNISGRFRSDKLQLINGTGLEVAGISTFNEGLFIPDTKFLRIGNSASDPDLLIAHDANSNTVIENKVGALFFKGTGSSGNIIHIQAKNNVSSAIFNPEAAALLHFNGTQKLETTGTGIAVPNISVSGVGTFSTRIDTNGVTLGTNSTTFAAKFADNARAIFGGATQGDFGIYHDTNHSYLQRIPGGQGDIYMMLGGDNAIIAKTDSSVELYWDDDKKLETDTGGVKITGVCTATSFSGDGSALTGITASGSGVVVKHDGSTVGTAGTINFSTNLDVSAISAGIVTVTSSGGSATTINNNANNRLITGSGTANTLEAESGLTYDGTYLNHIGSGFKQLKIDTSTSNSASLLLKNQQGNFTVNTINNAGNRNFTIYDGTAGETRFNINQGGTVGITSGLNVTGVTTITSSGQYPLIISSTDNAKMALQGSNNPYIYFREGTTNKGYIQWHSDGDFRLGNDESGEILKIKSGADGLTFTHDGTESKVFHAGNDGASSGLDADLLDGQEGSYYTNASNLGIGTIPNGRFPATLPAVSGANLTNLPVPTRVTVTNQAGDSTCNVLFAQSATGDQLPHTNANLTFNATNGTLTATTFSGSGASLTSIPAGQLTGTVADARISTLTASKLSGALPAISGANLTGIAVTESPVTSYTILGNSSSPNYYLSGGGVDESDGNPDLYLIRGQRYRFNNTTGSSHPFAFRVSSGGSAYTSGITGSQNGIQFFTVPLDAPAKIVYQCTIHGGMVGNIYIRGANGNNENVGVTTFTGTIHANETGDAKGIRIHSNGGISATNNELRFNTSQSSGFTFMANSDGSSSNERVRITSGGDLLIADSTNSIYNDSTGGGMNLKANGQLVLKKQATSISDPLMWLNDTGQTTNEFIVFAQDGTEKFNIGIRNESNLVFRDNQEDIAYMAAGIGDPLIGIGTNNTQGAGLMVASQHSSGTRYVNIGGPSSGTLQLAHLSGNGCIALTSSTGDLSIRMDTIPNGNPFNHGSEKVRIKSNGRVGVGTDDPNTTLSVYGSVNVTKGLYGRLYSGATTIDTGIMVGETNNFSHAVLEVIVSGNPNHFGSGYYRASSTYMVHISTGWTGSALSTRIRSTRISYGDGGSSNNSEVTATFHLYDATTSTESNSGVARNSNDQLRIKIAGTSIASGIQCFVKILSNAQYLQS